jgi:hypothetical protein
LEVSESFSSGCFRRAGWMPFIHDHRMPVGSGGKATKNGQNCRVAEADTGLSLGDVSIVSLCSAAFLVPLWASCELFFIGFIPTRPAWLFFGRNFLLAAALNLFNCGRIRLVRVVTAGPFRGPEHGAQS